MSVFFSRDGVIKEVACEPQDTCNNDQYSFKGIAAEWLGATVQIAPFTADTITPYLQASAKGAAASCSGGDNKTTCGFDWTKSKHDGKTGFGQELSALNVILANLATNASAPVAAATSSQNSTSSGSKSPSPSASTASTGTSASASVNPYSSSSRLLPLQTVASATFLIVAVAFFMM